MKKRDINYLTGFHYFTTALCFTQYDFEDKVPSRRYRSTTLIAARLDGGFTLPLLFEGSCDASAFNTWLKEMLCPLLDNRHVLIMDNASFHKGSETAAWIRASGRVYYFYPLMPRS